MYPVRSLIRVDGTPNASNFPPPASGLLYPPDFRRPAARFTAHAEMSAFHIGMLMLRSAYPSEAQSRTASWRHFGIALLCVPRETTRSGASQVLEQYGHYHLGATWLSADKL